MPWTGVSGALDTMCWDAASKKRAAIGGHVDQFATNTAASAWPVTKASKMKLRSLISASHIDNPYLSPTYVWHDGTDLIPLDDPAFDQVAAFLSGFPNLVAT